MPGGRSPQARLIPPVHSYDEATRIIPSLAVQASVRDDLAMLSGPAAYEARYGLTPTMGWTLAGSLGCALAVVLVPAPLVLRVVAIAFFGWGSLNGLAAMVSRKIALRVDEAGITLGGSPFRYRATTHVFPWADIERIVIWRRSFPVVIGRWTLFSFGSIRYVGVLRHSGAPPLPMSRARRLDWTAAGAPVYGIAGAKAPSAWLLDTQRLAAAVAICAPAIPVVDTAENSLT